MASGSLTEALRETLTLFEEGGAPRTTTEVADRLDLGRRSTYERLERLVDKDRLDTKKVGGNGRVWWCPRKERDRTSPDGGAAAESLIDDVSDRKREKSTHQTDREQFKSLVDAVSEYAIFMLDAEGHVQTWNSGAEQIKGYDGDEILGAHFSTFYTDEDQAAGIPAHNLETAVQEGSVEDEGWRVRANGSRFWANVTITAIRDDDGDLEGFAKVTRDMTDRRKSEQELSYERDLVRQILETVPVGIGLLSTTGDIVQANKRAIEILGIAEDEADGYEAGERQIYDVDDNPVPPDERPYAQVVETGESVLNWECQVEYTDGNRRWLSVNAVPLEGPEGEIDQIITAGKDITQLKEQAQRLERQRGDLESELDDVFNRVADGFYGLDSDLRFTYINDHAVELLDLSKSDAIGSYVGDEVDMTDSFKRSLVEAVEDGRSVVFEDYSESLDAWFENAIYPSESGVSVYFRNVTERKQRERDLRQYETIVETVNDGVYVLDAEAKFSLVNDAYCELTGYDRETLLGSTAATIVNEETQAAASQLETELMTGERERASLEADVQTADGKTIPAEATFAMLPGEGRRRVGVVRDITERKQFTEMLATLNESSRGFLDTESERDVNNVTIGAATEVLNLSMVVIYRYDEREDRLVPAAQSHKSEVMGPEPPTVAVGEGSITGSVFAAGESRYFTDVRASSNLYADRQETGQRSAYFVPMDDQGVLIVSSTAVDAFDEKTQDLVEILAANAEAAYNRVKRERKLKKSEHRYRTLIEQFPNGIVTLFNEEFRYLAAGGKLYETRERISEGAIGKTLYERSTPEEVEILEPHYRAALNGKQHSFEVEYGGRVLQFWTHPVTDDDGTIFAGMAMSQDVTEQREHQREIERQRKHLAALNDLNGVVRGITDAILNQSTQEEIEATVCKRLASTDSFLFAWIGDVDTTSQTVSARTEAGVEGFLDDITITVDPDDPPSQGPVGRALLTGEMQSTQDITVDDGQDPWQERMQEYGVRSSAAIPIVYEGTTYSVLNVYAPQPMAFEGQVREVIGQLGEIIGQAVAALERKRALLSDEVVELEFQIRNIFESLGTDIVVNDFIRLEHTVPLGEDNYVLFGRTTPSDVETVETMVETIPFYENVSFHDAGDETVFKLQISEPPVLSVIASLGGAVPEAVIEDGDYRMTIHLSPNVDVRHVIDRINEVYPTANLMKRHQRSVRDQSQPLVSEAMSDLTSRQRSALETAFHAGFFEWPRDSSGEEVSALLGVSAPTFHQHLRKAEQKVFESLLSSKISA